MAYGPSARRESRAAGRAVDLAVGENRDVPLRQGRVGLVLPEDDAVDAAQLGLEWMDDLVLGLDRRLDRAAERDQARQLGRRDPFIERGVERAAEGDVDFLVTQLVGAAR